jgi:hypothetical protein
MNLRTTEKSYPDWISVYWCGLYPQTPAYEVQWLYEQAQYGYIRPPGDTVTLNSHVCLGS